LQWLHYLLEQGEHPLQILTMLARQVRILIQVGELRKQGLVPQEIAGQTAVAPWMADKFVDQAQKFDMPSWRRPSPVGRDRLGDQDGQDGRDIGTRSARRRAGATTCASLPTLTLPWSGRQDKPGSRYEPVLSPSQK